MHRRFVALSLALGLLSTGSLFQSSSPAADKGDAKVPPALDFTMKDIKGKDVKLSQYQGKVVLLVNVASRCGYTPQYSGLEKLYEKYKDDGLVVVGVPANEFGKQEPGTDEEIQKFCTGTYNVTFPMMSKVVVKGKDICPLYKFLTSNDTDPQFAGDVKWNFERFLIDRSGKVVGRFRSPVEPQSPELVNAVEGELKKK
jgi:glutathione peroxidase